MNTNPENRNGYYVSAQMKRVWQIEMSIAQKLLDVCGKYQLGIWAEWGTLLGAVREKGFIPWDDDMDFMMFRKDYEKLLSVAKDEFQPPFFFQCFETEKDYYRGHAQVRIDGTSAILNSEIDKPFHQGIFIDIFIYDDIPDKFNFAWKCRVFIAECIRKSMNTALYPKQSGNFICKCKYIVSKAICTILPLKKQFLFLRRQFISYNGRGYLRSASPTHSCKRINRAIRYKCWYRETVYLPFEDMELPVPSEFDKVLTNSYGENYMTPINTSTSHGEIILNPDVSYKETVKNIKNNH